MMEQDRKRSWVMDMFNSFALKENRIENHTLRRIRLNLREITVTEAVIFAKIFEIEDFRDLLIIKLNKKL